MRQPDGGFTMVELIVAVTVFVIGVLSLLGVTAQVTSLLGTGDRVATGTMYAQERLEQLQGTDCSLLAAGSETRGGIYDLRWEISSMFLNKARRVRLFVEYPNRPGVVRQDTLETMVLCLR